MSYSNEHSRWLLKVKKDILKQWANEKISYRDALMMLYDIGVPTETAVRLIESA